MASAFAREDLESELRTGILIARLRLAIPTAALYVVLLVFYASLLGKTTWLVAASLLGSAILGWLTSMAGLSLLTWFMEATVLRNLSLMDEVLQRSLMEPDHDPSWRWSHYSLGYSVALRDLLAIYLKSCQDSKIEPFPWVLTTLEGIGMIVLVAFLLLGVLGVLGLEAALTGLLASLWISQLIQYSCAISLARAAMHDPRLCS